MVRNSMHIFETFEHDLLILNNLNGECLAKSAQFFYLVIFPVHTAAEFQTHKLTKSL